MWGKFVGRLADAQADFWLVCKKIEMDRQVWG